ncbi:hypothetical protein IU500_23530 [Nocardia terpenica]|uniref:Uncharacterized protein n=1 Tax=Nocardia terpenica TaxID=455432 RepID=A0A164P9H3_9NOCA|nr:hypothetical protein [Nocardia terpenica]KZM75282.1 hypothetical protein AWN90_17920 [Nocardia terpenica]MBF6063639.1 hypothetical protein [Nocardia terpenica]MBF6107015.1 hypothetical protein [Nocardia terpenica]MBF6114188.1 hypothetical protein [Nocardia terpenica]MBF6121725.1 hypothetical protein [Nocardia terpenica]
MDNTIAEVIAVIAHTAPERPLSLDRAHRVMQVHSGCSTESCRNKRAAFAALVDAGHIVPDSCRPRQQPEEEDRQPSG